MKNLRMITFSLVATLVAGCAAKANARGPYARADSVVVQEKDGQQVALPRPILAELSRNEMMRLPNCEDVDSTLRTLRVQIESCSDIPTSGRCKRLRDLIATWGEGVGVVGVHSATQYWSLFSSSPLFVSLEAARREVESQGYDPEEVTFASSAQGVGPLERVRVLTEPTSSWGPLLELMNYSDEDVVWDEHRGEIRTESHILGCALFSGEAQLTFVQETELEIQGADDSGSRAKLYWELYEWLKRHTNSSFASRSDALAFVGGGVASTVGVNADFLDTVQAAFELLFEEEGLALVEQTFQELRDKLAPSTAKVVLPATWETLTGPPEEFL